MWLDAMTYGEALTPDLIAMAYRSGYFPMTVSENVIGWFRPRMRALFPIEGIRRSRSLQRTLRLGDFEIRVDTDFRMVMEHCMRPEENWISDPILRVFTEIHAEGWAHCLSVWREGRLVGGIYGLALGTCFTAESMFHRETDMSKVALHFMVERCRASGFTMFDAQIMNPHLLSLGAFEIPDREYMHRLGRCLKEKPRPLV